MTDRKYFSGNSLEQAVMNAARHFKVAPEDLNYRQLDKRHGFVKVRRSHLIEVDPNSPRKPLSDDEAYKRAMTMDPEAHLGRDPNDRSYVTDGKRGGREQSRGRGRRRKSRGRKSSEPRGERQQAQERAPQQDDRGDRGGRNGRSRKQRGGDRRQEPQRPDSGNGRPPAPDAASRPARARPAPSPAAAEGDPSEGPRRVLRPAGREGRQVAEGPAAQVALDGAASLLRLGCLDLEATAYQGDDHLKIELSGTDQARVTHHSGELLAALQQLVPSIVRSKTGERVFCRVDCDGFREVHEERLRDLAQRVAGKVDRSQRAQVLESMNPAERRIIHITLNDDPSVTTESLGKGYFKRVRISPE